MLAERSKERRDLELKAAAVLELERRRKAEASKNKTVYGFYNPDGSLSKRLQDSGKGFVEVDAEPTITLPTKLEKVVTTKKRYKIILGGRGSAKSESIAGILLCRAKDYGRKVGCFREMQNSIEDSVHALLKSKIDSLAIAGFDIKETAITHRKGGEFKFKGLSRNPESVKSMHGFKDFWVEEAQAISRDSLKLLKPTLRMEGSEIFMSLNPQSSEDPVSIDFIKPFEDQLLNKGFYEDDIHLVVVMNYEDNPWFPPVLEEERKNDERILSSAEYNHIWNGAFNDTVDNAIIPNEWFDAAIDAHIKLGFEPEGNKIVAHDPSDVGEDPKGLAYRHGSVFYDIQDKSDGDLADGGDWAINYALDVGADLFVWDCDGMGVGLNRDVGRKFQGKTCQLRQFKGSNAPDSPDDEYERPDKSELSDVKTNKEVFRNKRSQYFWKLRDRFFKTYCAAVKGKYINPDELISLSSNIEKLPQIRSELCRIPRKPNPNGKIQVMSKDEMKRKYKLKSPNMADSMMMAMEICDSYSSYDDDYDEGDSWRTV